MNGKMFVVMMLLLVARNVHAADDTREGSASDLSSVGASTTELSFGDAVAPDAVVLTNDEAGKFLATVELLASMPATPEVIPAAVPELAGDRIARTTSSSALTLMPMASSSSDLGTSAGFQSKSTSHKKHRHAGPKLGSICIDTIFNNGHHAIIFSFPGKGRSFFIPTQSSRKVAAFFNLRDDVDLSQITYDDITETYHRMGKGKHSYLVMYTSSGLTVHKVTDKGIVTEGTLLVNAKTKSQERDLEVTHVVGGKTTAFKAVAVGILQKKQSPPAASSRRLSLTSGSSTK